MRPVWLTASTFDESVRSRLLARRVVTPSGCWEWSGARNSYGYGIIRVGGRGGWTERCHRVSHAISGGVVVRGLKVLHRCDNPPCFNPDHLFSGSASDNTADMHAKGRWKKPRVSRGSAAGTAKLTEAQVESIIGRLLSGETRTSVGVYFGVSMATISKIATGKNWAHLTAGRGIEKSTRGVKRSHV